MFWALPCEVRLSLKHENSEGNRGLSEYHKSVAKNGQHALFITRFIYYFFFLISSLLISDKHKQ